MTKKQKWTVTGRLWPSADVEMVYGARLNRVHISESRKENKEELEKIYKAFEGSGRQVPCVEFVMSIIDSFPNKELLMRHIIGEGYLKKWGIDGGTRRINEW